MRLSLAKISLFLLCITSFTSCNVLKRVDDGEYLLTKNSIVIDGKKTASDNLQNLIYQQPNGKLFGIPLRLYIYNLAREQRDSIFDAWIDKHPKRKKRLAKLYSQKQVDKIKSSALGFNNWIRTTGEAPVIIDTVKARKSVQKLKGYYFNNGWFNADVSYNITKTDLKKAFIDYTIIKNAPYILDSLNYIIKSPVIDSLFSISKAKSHIKSGDQYSDSNLKKEISRITTQFRNSGVYHFKQENIEFEFDTIKTGRKVLVDYIIKNRSLKKQDSTYQEPFKIYKIKEVNIITDYAFKNINKRFSDSTKHRDYNLYSYNRLRYNPKAITDAVFIKKGRAYSDLDRSRTYRYLSELKTFKYPNIEYIENIEDTTLTANILLSPRKKYNLNFDFDVSQSNIQTLGFSFSTGLLIRNVFRGAETLEISAIGAIGASKDASNTKDQFFDINELGVDLKLTIPRMFSPFKTDKIIPKFMSPTTQISLGATSQKNIGLDKQTINGIFNYKWYPKKGITNQFGLFNIQFIKNVNSANYFNIYNSSYNTLNTIAIDNGYTTDDLSIPEGTNVFISDVLSNNPSVILSDDDLQSVLSISERRFRLTQDNLIFATNFSFTKNNRENLYDESFSQFRVKFESAGNLFSLLNKPLSFEKNDDGNYQIFGVPYSQYGKIELDYTKHWDLSQNNDNVLAFRAFGGVAIPYGNSENIPFSKSYYGGGPNDNRAWEAYKLGPGKSQSVLDFNEANFKLAFNLEYRFHLAGNFEGALFTDAGNIWNVFDNIGTEDTEFKNLSALKDIAIGSGFGIRYDFSFFILRGDIGFKTYEPSLNINKRWFNNYNFGNAVYNIGINYPF